MKKLFLITVLVLSPVICNATFACVCPTIGQTTEQLKQARLNDYQKAAAIFTGKAVEFGEDTVTFKVDKIWKGNSVDEITMTTRRKYNGRYFTSDCDYGFGRNRRYLVFAYLEDGALRAYECSRNVPLIYAERAEEEIKWLTEIRLPEIRNLELKLLPPENSESQQ